MLKILCKRKIMLAEFEQKQETESLQTIKRYDADEQINLDKILKVY